MQLDLFDAAARNLESGTENSELRIPSPELRTPNPQPLVFVRHPRARRYVIRVIGDGTVRVTIPRRGSKREAAAFVEQERAWIEKQQRRLGASNPEPGTPNPERGIPNPEFGTPNPDPNVLSRAKRELPARLLELAAGHGLTVTRVSVRNQRSRWGSCSKSGHICLNWRLVDMPDWIRDYVMIHELMHLKRMDHSPRFWKLVARACPEYQDARRWLRQQHLTRDASSLPT